MKDHLIWVFLAVMVLILATRWLPFIFAERLKNAKMIENVGKQLPAYIMLLLLIYELKPSSFVVWPYALPQVIALLFVIIIHLWQRQVLLSMLVGVISYLILSSTLSI